MTVFLWIFYALVCAGLFHHATEHLECGFNRAKFATLALAAFCFGIDEFLRLFSGETPWLMAVGHISFCTFGVLYLAGRPKSWLNRWVIEYPMFRRWIEGPS